MSHFIMLPTNHFDSTHFPEHHPSRLPTSTSATSAANKRADFASKRRQFATMDLSISPKASIQHNLDHLNHLNVPKHLDSLPKMNGYIRNQEQESTTFSTLPSIIIKENINSSSMKPLLPKVMVSASTSTANPLVQPPEAYKKDPNQRIFVGRSLRLEKIKFFGFDMDYTLCNYKSPAYETLLFDHTILRLIDLGYPEQLKKLKYNKNFPVRGLWFDLLYGNLIKVDAFGNILCAVHGFKFLKSYEIEDQYPNKFMILSESRIIVLNTLFNLPDTFLLASLVDYFDSSNEYSIIPDRTGVRVRSTSTIISYKSIGQDLENAVNWVHTSGNMKRHVLENITQYVIKDDRIKPLLITLKKNGGQTFLLTNSEFWYTNGILQFLIGPDWTTYFDVVIVDAKKPHWFADGTVFREVDVSTGKIKLGIHQGPLKAGKVFAGGSCVDFRTLMKARGKDVLYVGDHIFGDVLRSKKSKGWRTFLVIPELQHELSIWTEKHTLFDDINNLDIRLAKLYKNLSLSSQNNAKSEITDAVKAIRNKTHELDQAYGILGSLFRSGSRITFFASQVERYADLYSSSPFNLLYYPGFYLFRSPMVLLPHESTVDHLSKIAQGNKDVVFVNREASRVQSTLIHEDEDDQNAAELNNNASEEECAGKKQSSTSFEIDEKNFALKARTNSGK